MDPLEYGDAFLGTIGDPAAAEALFREWITEIAARPRWSIERPDGRRIPWQVAGIAAERFEEDLARPGCYVFGAEPVVVRYVGETGASLRKRLFGRYLRIKGTSSAANLPQLLLAERYESAIRAKGIDAFPDAVVQAYKKSYKGGQARLVGAVDFVEHGLDGIWFTVLPLERSSQTKALETLLIGLANHWNRGHNLKPLCQVSHGYEYRTHLDGARPR